MRMGMLVNASTYWSAQSVAGSKPKSGHFWASAELVADEIREITLELE